MNKVFFWIIAAIIIAGGLWLITTMQGAPGA